MARSIGMALENPTPVYRGVILFLYPGVHNRPLKTYTTADGTEYLYHRASAYGPYGSKGPATAQVTSAIRNHNEWVKRGHYTNSHEFNEQTRKYELVPNGDSVPSLTAFVEEQVPAWTPIDGTTRTV